MLGSDAGRLKRSSMVHQLQQCLRGILARAFRNPGPRQLRTLTHLPSRIGVGQHFAHETSKRLDVIDDRQGAGVMKQCDMIGRNCRCVAQWRSRKAKPGRFQRVLSAAGPGPGYGQQKRPD